MYISAGEMIWIATAGEVLTDQEENVNEIPSEMFDQEQDEIPNEIFEQDHEDVHNIAPQSQDEDSDTAVFTFSNENVLLLLDLVLENKTKYRDRRVKKEKFWRELAESFIEMGYFVTGNQLDKKFRNLKQTYLKLKDNNGKTGRGRSNWPFYKKFEEIFAEDCSVNAKSLVNIVSSSVQSSSGGPLQELCKSSKTDVDKKKLEEASTPKRPLEEANSFIKKRRRSDPQWIEEMMSLQKEQAAEVKELKSIMTESNRIQNKR